jgi:hypothetical protein
MKHFQVVYVVEDIMIDLEFGKTYTVTDIIEAGSPEETYILEGTHSDGSTVLGGVLAYSDLFVTLDEWRDIQIKKILC